MKHLEERKICREEIYDGAILHVVKDTVLLPNGRNAFREVALHPGAVAVVPLDRDGYVYMEKQYRYPMGAVLDEIPAGKLEYGENPDEGVKRELREETGLCASSWTNLGVFIPSPAILGERIQLYLAEGLTQGETSPDEDEFLDVERVPLEVLVQRVMAGEIPDGKTQCAILRVYYLLQQRKSEQ